MRFQNTYVPYGGYWATPFTRWQGNFSSLSAIPFAAEMTTRALKDRNISPESFDSLYLGITIPQKHSFYGQTWFAGLIGVPEITGPMIAQACATSARVIANAASEIEATSKDGQCILTVT